MRYRGVGATVGGRARDLKVFPLFTACSVFAVFAVFAMFAVCTGSIGLPEPLRTTVTDRYTACRRNAQRRAIASRVAPR
jgi:hypothetical protein